MSSMLSRFKRVLSLRRRDGSDAAASTPTSNKSSSHATVANARDLDPIPHGLQIVAEGKDPQVDIVAVHGLHGHRSRTWTAENQVNWLCDLLPHDVPHARIFCWGYDAKTRNSDSVSCHYLYDHARSLISDLCQERKHSDSVERPIIFVAYSLGGIIVKSALIHSDATRPGALEEHRSIKTSTYAIIFMGTPHQGANGVQLGKLLVNIASLFVAADDRLLKHLERDSEWLQQQLGQYSLISDQFITKFAYEEYPTPTAFGKSLMVVPRASAVVPSHGNAEPIAIHANHHNMVKYTSKEDVGYRSISRHLKDMANEAVEQIQRRWQAEKRSNEGNFSLFSVSEVNHFVARGDELAQLHDILGEGSDRRVAVVHGLGGMGKTQLAIAYAKRHRNDYSAVFCANARDELSLKQGFLWMAGRILEAYPSLRYIEKAVQAQDLDEAVRAVKRWFDNPGNNNWLIIYDNYDNHLLGEDERCLEGDAPSNFYDIRDFFPDVYQGAILITTRSSRVELGHRVPLKKIDNIEHSLEILSHTSQRQELNKDAAATGLAQELDGLPLALSTAGAYLHNTPTTCAEYLGLYRESWRRLQITSPPLLSYDQALYSTWDISYAQVKRQNAASAMLLQLWAYFDHEDLWLELLQGGQQRGPPWFQRTTKNSIEFNQAVRVLCDYGLAEPSSFPTEHTESRGYAMHTCVHAWTMHMLNETKNDDLTRLATVCVASKIPKDSEKKYYIAQRRLSQHAAHCSKMILNTIPDTKGDEWVLQTIGRLFKDQSQFRNAEAMYERALKSYETSFGLDHVDTLEINNNLGIVYSKQGRFQQAEAVYERTLRGREKALGPDHPDTLRTINNLGIVYWNQGRLQEAEGMYKRTLQGREKALGADHLDTLMATNNLGLVYWEQGRLQEAESMYERALQGYETELGPDHPDTLMAIHNFGIVYRETGRLKKAEAMYERALQGYEKALGPEHPDTLIVMNNFGVLYRDQNRAQDAEVLYQQVLQGREKALGPDHTDTLRTVNNLGNLYRDHGRLQEAEVMYERALQGHERAPTHKSHMNVGFLDNLHDFAKFRVQQGLTTEARSKYQRCQAGLEAAFGTDHSWYKEVTEELELLCKDEDGGS